MMGCPVHNRRRLPPGLEIHANAGQPDSRFYDAIQRIGQRLEGAMAAKYEAAAAAVRRSISLLSIRGALPDGPLAVQNVLQIDAFARNLADPGSISAEMRAAYSGAGGVSAEVMEEALGLSYTFDAVDPRALAFARQRTAGLVAADITRRQKEAIRVIMADAQFQGFTTQKQAQLVHKVVGLRPSHAMAPANLGQEIRNGWDGAATSRRLDAVTKQQIRSRIKKGTVTEEFIEEVEERYAHSLRRRRALDIARTETARASNAGVQGSFEDAQMRGVLGSEARRFPVVTPDSRLRVTHLEVVEMNPEGVAISEPFETPFGALMYPPWEPNCRCAVALMPGGGGNVLL